MRTSRLRGPGFVLLLSLSACANIWGFDDLHAGDDDGGVEPDVTTQPPDARPTEDVRADQSIVDHASPDVDHPDVVHDAGRDVDSSIPDAHDADADTSVPDAHDADADVVHETGPVDTGLDAPDALDVTVGPDANDASDSTVPDTGPDVTVEAAPDSPATPTDVTALGTIVTSATMPTGAGNPDPEVIRDGVFPPVDSTDPTTEYDTNDGTTKIEDYVGYIFAAAHTFSGVVFQDGIQSAAGGWFATIQIEVEDGTGAWNVVPATVAPAYVPDDGHNFETFTFTLTPPVTGIGIRVDGEPGGTGTYVSVGELRVSAQ